MKNLLSIIVILMLAACSGKPTETITSDGVTGTYVLDAKNKITIVLKSAGKMEIFAGDDPTNTNEIVGGPENNYKIIGNQIELHIQGGGTSSSEIKAGAFDVPGLGGVFRKQ